MSLSIHSILSFPVPLKSPPANIPISILTAESFQPSFDFDDDDFEDLEGMDEDEDEDEADEGEDQPPAKKARN